ncbi:ATP-binding protein [Acetobacterium woodii]|uniref:histidine kinase n=1 Tax=Acetobacterium woodii (strain ATCC 29683 / DSM 1030 / JCM 2381 / KCTC 1655 / WB1) TaxID=931626 RepID=H6LDL5_ACEWD|nr:ATP-binding protein [Acetobacterium woodii]AFA49179.1 phosphate regulon sensor protein PhoR2 [Acetobacterium woodii DSM 1030]
MKKRLLVPLIIIIVVSISAIGLFTSISYRQSYYADTENNIKKSSNYIVKYLLPDFLETGNKESLDHYATSTSVRMTIINLQGDVIYESTPDLGNLENHKNRPEILGALAGNVTTEVRFSNTVKDEMIYVATPYYDENNTLTAVLRISVPVNAMDDAMFEMINNIIFVMLTAILATILLITYVINRELKPLEDATVFAEKIASGKYGQQLTMIREDQIGELVESLNQMSAQLNHSFTEMNQKNAELTSILANMNHGVIAIDMKNRIVHLNDGARHILRIPMKEIVVGKNILEVYRESFILELMTHLENEECEKVNFESRIHENRILRIYINQIKEDEQINGHIIILEDITFLKKLETMRRDFVANVSHELKTPITTIRGFIETIQENHITDPQTLERFYSIIYDESDRLSRLVNDILVLSQLENKGGFDRKFEVLELNVEIKQIFDILKFSAEAKEITFLLTAEKPLKLELVADEFRQMMINLIDNAIKYSEPGKPVEVVLAENEEQVIIKVIDQGYGIPEKDVERIFERFYRVDKSRSKEKGGTGLGLAIVKHIVYNNGGTIKVDSHIGEGTEFVIELPKNED